MEDVKVTPEMLGPMFGTPNDIESFADIFLEPKGKKFKGLWTRQAIQAWEDRYIPKEYKMKANPANATVKVIYEVYLDSEQMERIHDGTPITDIVMLEEMDLISIENEFDYDV